MKKRILCLALIIVLLAMPLLPVEALSPLPWLQMTAGSFFLVDITAIDDSPVRFEVPPRSYKDNADVVFMRCYADFYLLRTTYEEKLYDDIEFFYIDIDYADSISVGDTFLVELDIYTTDPDSFGVRYSLENLEILPIVDGGLVFTEQFTDGNVFRGLRDYVDYIKRDDTRFFEGMSRDDIIALFSRLPQDRADYQERFNEMAQEMAKEMHGTDDRGNNRFTSALALVIAGCVMAGVVALIFKQSKKQ